VIKERHIDFRKCNYWEEMWFDLFCYLMFSPKQLFENSFEFNDNENYFGLENIGLIEKNIYRYSMQFFSYFIVSIMFSYIINIQHVNFSMLGKPMHFWWLNFHSFFHHWFIVLETNNMKSIFIISGLTS